MTTPPILTRLREATPDAPGEVDEIMRILADLASAVRRDPTGAAWHVTEAVAALHRVTPANEYGTIANPPRPETTPILIDLVAALDLTLEAPSVDTASMAVGLVESIRSRKF